MKVDHEVLKAYLNAQDKELTKLHNYIEDLEDLRRNQKIPPTWISFEIRKDLDLEGGQLLDVTSAIHKASNSAPEASSGPSSSIIEFLFSG